MKAEVKECENLYQKEGKITFSIELCCNKVLHTLNINQYDIYRLMKENWVYNFKNLVGCKLDVIINEEGKLEIKFKN